MFTTIEKEYRKAARSLTQIERDYVDRVARDFSPYEFKGPKHTKARRFFIRKVLTLGIQNVHTPYTLCNEIVSKLKEYTTLDDKKICVLFNIEFVDVLIYDFGVKPENIYFFADADAEFVSAVGLYGLTEKRNAFVIDVDGCKKTGKLMSHVGECKMKFDVVLGNPPYQAEVKQPKNKPKQGFASGGHTLWEEFIPLSFGICVENGYVCLIHPARWRKPDDATGKFLKTKNMHFLRIFNKRQGEQLFGAKTRADWYVCENCVSKTDTHIVDENGNKHTLNFSGWHFIPNFDYDLVGKNMAQENKDQCQLLYDSSAYHTMKPWVSQSKNNTFKYPLVASTGQVIKLCYSRRNNNGLFGVKKVIFGASDTIKNAIIDMEGNYGMTENAMAIPVDSETDAKQIKIALESDKFDRFLKACRWSNFRIDYKVFGCLRHDFWKEFLP